MERTLGGGVQAETERISGLGTDIGPRQQNAQYHEQGTSVVHLNSFTHGHQSSFHWQHLLVREAHQHLLLPGAVEEKGGFR